MGRSKRAQASRATRKAAEIKRRTVWAPYAFRGGGSLEKILPETLERGDLNADEALADATDVADADAFTGRAERGAFHFLGGEA